MVYLESSNMPMIPQRTFETYKRLVSLAIEMRKLDTGLVKNFRVCVPLMYVHALAQHFPDYLYSIIGGCFTDSDAVYVTWMPGKIQA